MALILTPSSLSWVSGCFVNRTKRQKLVENIQNQKVLAHGSFHLDLANLQAVAELCQSLVFLEQEVSWFQVR